VYVQQQQHVDQSVLLQFTIFKSHKYIRLKVKCKSTTETNNGSFESTRFYARVCREVINNTSEHWKYDPV